MDAQPYVHPLFDLPTTPTSVGSRVETSPSAFLPTRSPAHLPSPTRRQSKKPKVASSIGDAQNAATRSKKTQPKFRNWVFTINNPPVDAEGLVIPPKPLAWHRHVYSIWQLERGENGTLHWQGYVEFSGQFSLSQLKNSCAELASAHLEGRRGSADQAVSYCRPEKGGSVRDPTVVSDTPLEFGDRKQVCCYHCYCWIYRHVQLFSESIGFIRPDYDNVISQMYYLPGELGEGPLVHVPCPCLVATGDSFPPKFKLIFPTGSFII